jgi:hypothetical protein
MTRILTLLSLRTSQECSATGGERVDCRDWMYIVNHFRDPNASKPPLHLPRMLIFSAMLTLRTSRFNVVPYLVPMKWGVAAVSRTMPRTGLLPSKGCFHRNAAKHNCSCRETLEGDHLQVLSMLLCKVGFRKQVGGRGMYGLPEHKAAL